MDARRTILLTVAVSLFATGCGGDEGSGATTSSLNRSSTVATTPSVSPTDLPATTTTLPPVPTTTLPPVPTTTLPPDPHQVAGILWSDLLPGPDARAVYRVDMVVPDTPMSHEWGVAGDLEARMEYGVEWFGRECTYDRLVIGLDTPETPGLVFWFHLDGPWVVEFLGMEAWADGDTGRGPSAVETFAEPATLDLSGQPGETFTVEGKVTAIDSFGVEDLDASVAVTLRNGDAGPLAIAAGTFEQAIVYEILLYGPIVGGPDFVIEITVGPGNLILGMSMPGAAIELLEPWG